MHCWAEPLCHVLFLFLFQLLGGFIERYGSGECFGVLIADAEEAW